MAKQTQKRRTTLTIRLTEEEYAMLEATREYVRKNTRTVLGSHEITHAEALKLLAATGYKRVDAEIKREAAKDRHATPIADDDTKQISATSEAIDTVPPRSKIPTG